MSISRRDFVKASALLGAALGVKLPGILKDTEALALEGGLPVVWLQAQACTGDSVSFLNSIHYATPEDLLLNTLDVNFHPNIMAGAGQMAVDAAIQTRNRGGYVLVVEGAIPTGANGSYAMLWPGTTALAGVKDFASKAAHIIAVGTCASFGGVVAGAPNPTQSKGVLAVLGAGSAAGQKVINVPGCPVHPDWLVGTIAYMLTYGRRPELDANRRPTAFFGKAVHDICPLKPQYDAGFGKFTRHSEGKSCFTCHEAGDEEIRGMGATALGQSGCLFALGCKGLTAKCDCSVRKWNGGAPETPGVNWCVGAGSPCIGCTEPVFPDRMSPFFTLNGPGVEDDD